MSATRLREATIGMSVGSPRRSDPLPLQGGSGEKRDSPPRLIPPSRQCERRRANCSPLFPNRRRVLFPRNVLSILCAFDGYQSRVFIGEYNIHLAERGGLEIQRSDFGHFFCCRVNSACNSRLLPMSEFVTTPLIGLSSDLQSPGSHQRTRGWISLRYSGQLTMRPECRFS